MSQRGPRDWIQPDIPTLGRGVRRRSGGSFSRGVWSATAAVPVAVVCWVLLASVGIISSLIAYLFALAVVWLFTRGSGGLVSARGARAITVIVVVGVIACVAAGALWAGASAYASGMPAGPVSPFAALADPAFWVRLWEQQVVTGRIFASNAVDLALGLLFAAAGVFPILLALRGRRIGRRTSIGVSVALLGAAVVVVWVANQLPIGAPDAGGGADGVHLTVGDCLLDGDPVADGAPTIVACDQPHHGEVFAEVALPEAPVAGYPDASWFASVSPPGCEAAFAGFIGHPVDGSSLQVSSRLPGEIEWAAGERSELCVVRDPAALVTASFAGAQR
ncbi:septum formation family protein [Herbiconiux liangxiaofengii]|uniref:septum formation family protein n=1 Tax=Herbiconiux liangxiaofengii TaxID=3342795 RepID=UPI0035B8D814